MLYYNHDKGTENPKHQKGKKIMKTTNTIIKDITDEYIAIVATEDAAYVKNVTEWINEITAEDLDETSEGWVEVSLDEAEEMISNGTIVDEA